MKATRQCDVTILANSFSANKQFLTGIDKDIDSDSDNKSDGKPTAQPSPCYAKTKQEFQLSK